MSFLTSQQERTFQLYCDTLNPSLQPPTGSDGPNLFLTGAVSLGVDDQLLREINKRADESAKASLARLLSLMESRWFNLWLARRFRRFSRMSLDDRTRLLQKMRDSRSPKLRRVFQSLKRKTMFLSYASQNGDPNPAWQDFGYIVPSREEVRERADGCIQDASPITPLAIGKDTTLMADVVVIGSGAGGSVVAAELTAAGHDVLIVEKGAAIAPRAFPCDEREGNQRMYEGGGSVESIDGSMVVLAGSTLGGGTAVNWMTSLRPPEDVLHQWAELGFQEAAGPQFQSSVDLVCERLHVNTRESDRNNNNFALERGCQKLGYDWQKLPRNAKGCDTCDFCMFGCPSGGKQDTTRTYLQDAVSQGARVLANAHVDAIDHQGGVAKQVTATVRRDGGVSQVEIRCRAVVVAAGAIHSPAILKRSGFTNSHIGQHLYLHPTTAVVGRFKEAIRPWRGVPQSRVCNEFANLSGDGYGVRLEACPAHPGLSALAMPWSSGLEHKRLMQQMEHLSNTIVLTRDRHSGQVILDRNGRPQLDYEISPHDSRHLIRGVVEALRVQRAAGAIELYSPHHNPLQFVDDRVRANETEFDAFLDAVTARGAQPNTLGLFSAHQMGTCRIAGRAADGAVDPTARTFEVSNVFVVDASVMPTPCGVNPMITIMAVAHHLAQHIKLTIAQRHA